MTTHPSRPAVSHRTKPSEHPANTAAKPVGVLLAATSLLVLLFGSTYAMFVRTRVGQRVDQQFLQQTTNSVNDRLNSPDDPALTVLSTLGNPLVLVALLATIVLVGLASRRGTAALAGVVVTAASIGGAGLLKHVMGRPDLGVAGSMTHNSFPSGHVAAAASLVFALLLALPRQARWWCLVPGIAGICVVGAATVVAGWHRLSDVLGGVFLAAALTCLAAAGKRIAARMSASAPTRDAGAAAGGQRNGL